MTRKPTRKGTCRSCKRVPEKEKKIIETWGHGPTTRGERGEKEATSGGKILGPRPRKETEIRTGQL